MDWRQKASDPVSIKCPGGHTETLTALECGKRLKEADDAYEASNPGKGRPFHSYGDHVSDPLAVVKRLLHFMGWKDVPGTLRKMACPEHQENDEG